MQEVLPEWRTAVLLRVVVAKFPLLEVIHYFFSSIFHGHLRELQMFGYRMTYWRWRCYLAAQMSPPVGNFTSSGFQTDSGLCEEGVEGGGGCSQVGQYY